MKGPLIFLSFAFGGFALKNDLIKFPNGNLAIRGKSCGVLEKIKYLTEIPDDPENHQCTIILQPKKIGKSFNIPKGI